jgi:tRNA isopentenyl-2-thiomethyl-A-37 hydroxylase MiaE
MKNPTDIGLNRTGIGVSPVHAKELIEGAAATVPSSLGDESAIAEARIVYAKDMPPIGTVPPPSTLKGMAETVIQLIKGNKGGVLLDKIGERIGFERTGGRLYEGLMAKFSALGSWEGGPTLDDLRKIHHEELTHFALVTSWMVKLGADPTAMTPSADLAGVESMGVIQVITDPRTTPSQALHAILVAELIDVDSWSLLVELAAALGQEDMAREFRAAQVREEQHVTLVRGWLKNYVIGEGTMQLDEVEA